MIKIDVQHNILEIKDKLSWVDAKKWPKLLAYASTETAFYVRNKLRREMPNYIDRPTQFTLKSIFVQKGNLKDAESFVQWRKPSGGNSGGRYLKPLVDSGNRQVKGFELLLQAQGLMPRGYVAVPDKNVKRDAYGNVSSAFIRKIVDQVIFNPNGSAYGSSRGTGRTLNKNVKGIKERKTSVDSVVVFVIPKRSPTTRLAPGIYERRMGALGASIRRLFGFYPTATYNSSFPFYELGTKASLEMFPSKLDEAISKHENGEKGF